jgi:SAM-dependent methyltransferase
VDYERAADEYARRRAPSDTRLAIWGEALRPHLSGRDVVVDLGAGTGAFSRALREWGARRVVAVEPSAAMQARSAPASGVHPVTGRAEAIPLGGATVDAIWISTAFHHFADPRRAVGECRRVLTGRGTVLVRGFVPGHTELAWLDLFPGAERAVARFPDLATLEELFLDAGLHLLVDDRVAEAAQTYADRAEFCQAMRHADSILTALSDAEVDAGIAALRSRSSEIEHLALSLLVFGPPA